MVTKNDAGNDSANHSTDSRPALASEQKKRLAQFGIKTWSRSRPRKPGLCSTNCACIRSSWRCRTKNCAGHRRRWKHSAARYFDLYDLAPVGYVTLSEKGLILEANLIAASLLGVPKGTFVNKRLAGYIVPEDQDIHYRCCKQLFETAEPQACELRSAAAGWHAVLGTPGCDLVAGWRERDARMLRRDERHHQAQTGRRCFGQVRGDITSHFREHQGWNRGC